MNLSILKHVLYVNEVKHFFLHVIRYMEQNEILTVILEIKFLIILGYHYYILSLSDLCSAVKKKILKEIWYINFAPKSSSFLVVVMTFLCNILCATYKTW